MMRIAHLLIIAPLMAQPVLAQDAPAPQDFVSRSVVSTMFTVEAATLALHQSDSDAVKAFAHRAVDRRAVATSQLRQITAKRSDIALPERPDERHAAWLRDLSQKRGGDFDRAFARAQRESHAEIVAVTASFAEKGADPELQKFARDALPVVEELGAEAGQLPGAQELLSPAP